MGVFERLRRLDDRAVAVTARKQLTERTAWRVGVGFAVVGVVFMLAGIFGDPFFSAAVFNTAFAGGLLLGRVTEARAVRKGVGALRPSEARTPAG